MQVKEIKENLNIDLTEYEHKIIFLSLLMEGLMVAFNSLVEKSYSSGVSRKELHGFSSLFECFLKQAKEFDESFYEEVISEVERIVGNKFSVIK